MERSYRDDASTPLGIFLRDMLALGGTGSMAALSRETGIASQSFRRWMKGEVEPKAEMQLKLAQAFDLSPEECKQFGLEYAAEHPPDIDIEVTTGDEDRLPLEYLEQLMGSLATRARTGPPLGNAEVDFVLSVYGISRSD